MRIENTNKAIFTLYERVDTTYRDAIQFNSDHRTILNGLTARVYKHERWSKIPQWAQTRIGGYIDAQFHVLYRDHLEWRVRLDSVLVPSEDVPDGSWANVTAGDYVWTKSPDHQYTYSEEK